MRDSRDGLLSYAVGCVAARCAILLTLCTLGAAPARAQLFDARINVVSLSPARVRIEGERRSATKVWSFRNAYAGVTGLGERIENLALADARGQSVAVRKLAPGEYEAAGAATRFSYEVRVEAPAMAGDAAYVSWLTSERGFLMLGDLLPRPAEAKESAAGATVSFALPAGWAIKTLELKRADAQFEVADAQSAVFYVGLDLRERRERVGSMETAFVTGGDWAFSDEDVASTAASILKDHLRTMGGAARARMMLMLTPFPRPVSAERWSAETRGATVMLLSGRFPSRTAALAQLSAPLTHELFHLWVPNGLALDGQYDWFYEGFTLYQALRAGMRLDLLTFQDYLNALGRAFDAYATANGRDHLSLLEASQRRWTGTTTLVYQKGMLVAFLYDLTLRRHTRGERSLDDVYRELFRHHRLTGTRKDGNAAVIAALNGQSGMLEFVRRHIESAGQIDLAALLAPFGLRVEREGVRTRVLVADSLSREQRDLLRGFGYNAEKRTRPQRQRGE